jgi:hypothetical protein
MPDLDQIKQAEQASARPARGRFLKPPTIEDAVKAAGFLAGRPEDIIEALQAVERRYPGLDRVICATPLGTPARGSVRRPGAVREGGRARRRQAGRRRLPPRARDAGRSVRVDPASRARCDIPAMILGGRTKDGGGGGIRTRETIHHRLHTFQACAFNRSATPPMPCPD